LVGEKARVNLDAVVELRVVHDGKNRAAGAGFGIRRGVDEAGDAGVEDGSGAHGAGFECHVKGAIFDAVVGEVAAGFAEGDYFGVGGGIGVAEDAVLASADDFPLMNNDCADRDFAGGLGSLRFGDGSAEMVEVVTHLPILL